MAAFLWIPPGPSASTGGDRVPDDARPFRRRSAVRSGQIETADSALGPVLGRDGGSIRLREEVEILACPIEAGRPLGESPSAWDETREEG